MSLKKATEYWLLLQRASAAADSGRWQDALLLYQQAQRQDSTNIFALTGLAHSYYHLGDEQTAWRYYKKAAQTDPRSETAQRAVLSYTNRLPPVQALRLMEELPASAQQATLLQSAVRDYKVSRFEEQAEQARSEEHTSELQSRGHLVCRLLLDKKRK